MKQIRRFLFLLTFIPMFVFQLIMIVLWLPLSVVFLLVSMARYIAVGKWYNYGKFFLEVICSPCLIHENLTSRKFFHPDMVDGDEDAIDEDIDDSEDVDYDYEEYEE